jgi:hypothetical protein
LDARFPYQKPQKTLSTEGFPYYRPGIQPAVFQTIMQRIAPANNEEDHVSAGTWMLITFIMVIPIMGIMALALFMGLGDGLMKRLHSWTHKA